MRVTYRTFNVVAIVLGLLAVVLLPFWHFGSWGYIPSIVAIAALVGIYMLRAFSIQ